MDDEPGAYIYMLRCADGSYYVGSARRGLERRVSEHNNGTYGGYISRRLPVELVWAQHFPDITDAIAVERQLKGWSRAKKQALLRGDYEAIRLLAGRRTSPTSSEEHRPAMSLEGWAADTVPVAHPSRRGPAGRSSG